MDEYRRALGQSVCCYWGAVLEVRHPVVIAGQRFPVGTQFAYDVSAEEMVEGGAFVCRLVTGPFSRTDRVDYCEPTVRRPQRRLTNRGQAARRVRWRNRGRCH